MKQANTKSVRMTYKALVSYILNTNYRSASGVMGLVISVGSLAALIATWDKSNVQNKLVLLAVGLLFTVINPIVLSFKAFRQLKLSPSYKKPIDYTFFDEGVGIRQGEQEITLTWDMIVRLMLTKSMLAIYTSRVHAFVIPVSELGEDSAKIITSVVQFTENYGPRLSGNLKAYRTGKGIK